MNDLVNGINAGASLGNSIIQNRLEQAQFELMQQKLNQIDIPQSQATIANAQALTQQAQANTQDIQAQADARKWAQQNAVYGAQGYINTQTDALQQKASQGDPAAQLTIQRLQSDPDFYKQWSALQLNSRPTFDVEIGPDGKKITGKNIPAEMMNDALGKLNAGSASSFNGQPGQGQQGGILNSVMNQGVDTTSPQVNVPFGGSQITVPNSYLNRTPADAQKEQTANTSQNQQDLQKDQENYRNAQNSLGELNQFDQLNKANPDPLVNAVMQHLPNTQAQLMKTIADRYSSSGIKQIFNRTTENELNFVKKASISPTAGPDVNNALIPVLKGIAQDEINYHDLKAGLGTNASPAVIDSLWSTYKSKNPIVDDQGNARVAGRPTPQQYFSSPKVNSADDYAKLPSGSSYLDSNGTFAIKPQGK